MDQGHVAKVIDPDSGNVLYRYYYDAGGQRRIKARGDSTDGIMDNASFSFYAGNDLICQLDRGEQIQDDKAYQPKFLLLDHLGTTRAELKFVEDDDTGEIIPTIASGYDYMPYGELITEDHLVEALPGNPDPRTEQVLFTGKPRDKETGLDDFGPRKYSSMLARWMSPDELFADNHVEEPQSWNLYSYVRLSPINSLDTDGRSIWKKIYNVYKVLRRTKNRIPVGRVNQISNKKAVKQVANHLDTINQNTSRRVVEAETDKARDVLAKRLSTDGKIREAEKHAGYPEHVHPKEGPYSDVHVQTIGKSSAGIGILGEIFAPYSEGQTKNPDRTEMQVASAALWDFAATIDIIFLTDLVEWGFDLEPYDPNPSEPDIQDDPAPEESKD